MMKRDTFTLIEAVIAVGLLVVVLGSVVSIFYQGFRYQRKAKDKLVAINFARALLEKYSDWEALDKLDSSDSPYCSSNGTVANTQSGLPYSESNRPTCVEYYNDFDLLPAQGVTYNPELAISDGPVDDGSRLKRLTVTITWTVAGQAKSFTVETYEAYY